MTVSTTDNHFAYSGDGLIMAFLFPGLVFANADLVVTLVDDATGVGTLQVLATFYNVSGALDAAGGTVLQ